MRLNQKHVRLLLFALLFGAWMFPGLIGRDLWKADEPYSFGLVLNMLQTGDYVVPTLGSEPFMEKPPIFYITSAACARLFSPPFELHEAARGACVFYVLLALLFTGLASRELNGPRTAWVAPVLLLGCIGWVHTAHMLMTDNSLLAGFALAAYGLALARRRIWLGGFLCGTGTGLAFLSKGLLGPGLLGLTVLGLPILFKSWRTRDYWRLLGGIFLGVLPWVVIWPSLLYARSPVHFNDWFWNNNLGRYLGTSPLVSEYRGPLYYIKKLPYFALPVLPLALWAAWRERRAARQEFGVGMPLLMFFITLVVLSFSKQGREVYALSMLVPLSLLATRVAGDLSPKVAAKITLGLFIFLGLFVAVCWAAWIMQLTGRPPFLLQAIQKGLPNYQPVFQVWAFAFAALATAAWLLSIILFKRESLNLWTHWAAGVALLYLLGMSLWLPVTNANMSYRRDFSGLREALGPSPGVVASRNLGEPQRAVLHYYAQLVTFRPEMLGPTNYNWLLIQGEDKDGKRPQAPDDSWLSVWDGRHHHKEIFRLYQRRPAAPINSQP